MSGERRLHVNADDFGFTSSVNHGIIAAHRDGILTATTLMANGDAYEEAVELAHQTPSLDVGVHAVLVQGRSLVTGKPLPATLTELIPAVMLRRMDPYRELRAQVEKITASGIRPTHMDAHKHAHLLPPVLDALTRLAVEFGIPWVRTPFDMRATTWKTRAVGLMEGHMRRVLRRRGLRTTEHFVGLELTGHLNAEALLGVLRSLPEGRTELMTHPGVCDAELLAAPTRLKESRAVELAALTDARAREAIATLGIRLARYTA